MIPTVIMAIIYAATIALAVWWLQDDYIEFFGTIRMHMINAAIIVGFTALVVILTWDLLAALFSGNRHGWRIMGRTAMRLVLLYEVIPCAVFMTRYGVVDLGEYQRARWPMVIGGWAVAALATGYLLFMQSVLR